MTYVLEILLQAMAESIHILFLLSALLLDLHVVVCRVRLWGNVSLTSIEPNMKAPEQVQPV